MNLTAEHIDTIRWAYKNPDIDALCDMAKRTLEAEAKLAALKNAASAEREVRELVLALRGLMGLVILIGPEDKEYTLNHRYATAEVLLSQYSSKFEE